MLRISKLQPSWISFYKYRLNPTNFKQFENLFCNWLGFSKSSEIAEQTFVYKNRSAFYIIQLADEVSYPILDGLGIHLAQRKTKEENLFSKTNNGNRIDADLYVENILDKSKVAKQLAGNILPITGLDVSGIQFYFTVNEDFSSGGIFYNSKASLGFQSLDELENKSFKRVGRQKRIILYHHHAAFYRLPEQIAVLEEFCQTDLRLKPNNSYLLPDAQQFFTAFQLNQVRLNTIRPTGVASISPVQVNDFYSHAALGSPNIIDFARRIRKASKTPENGVEVIPMGGNNSKIHYEATKKMYSHLLTQKELEDIEKYHINFETDLENPNNSAYQFFFCSALGLVEGISTRGKFSFRPRVGEGVTRGISINVGVN